MKRPFRRFYYVCSLLILLFLGAGSFRAAEHHSFFTLACNGGVTFHLIGVDGLQFKPELVLGSYGGGGIDWRIFLPDGAWKDVVGERCSGVGKCELATSARIWIEKADAKQKDISGKYEVVFGEQHFQGQFVAKYKKHQPRIECL